MDHYSSKTTGLQAGGSGAEIMPKRQPTLFTEPFTVSDGIRELAKKNGWPNPDLEKDYFVDYYESIGWKMKGGQPIVDREAAFRMWLRRHLQWSQERTQQENEPVVRTGAWGRKLG